MWNGKLFAHPLPPYTIDNLVFMWKKMPVSWTRIRSTTLPSKFVVEPLTFLCIRKAKSSFTARRLTIVRFLVAVICCPGEILQCLKGPIHDQSCCATLRVVQHDWSCMVLIDLIVNGQTWVAQNNFAQHDWSCMGPFKIAYYTFRPHFSQFFNDYHFPIIGYTVDEVGKAPWSKLKTLATCCSPRVRADATKSYHWRSYMGFLTSVRATTSFSSYKTFWDSRTGKSAVDLQMNGTLFQVSMYKHDS
jgi:hypothetical protein